MYVIFFSKTFSAVLALLIYVIYVFICSNESTVFSVLISNISGVCFLGSEQSKQIVFAPSVEPTFVNVPQNNFVEPFVLNPGTWTVVIEAEGILLVRRTPHICFYTLQSRTGDTKP